MANLLNALTSNNSFSIPDFSKSSSYDTTDRIKPLPNKAVLLPSSIIGSPIDSIKDMKQDIVNIGKAVSGKANDHELGRMNDLGMKLGSLGIAAYLFAKNPMGLSKKMQFIGFGTFFASMSLWPKLIQIPMKQMTGVDFQQEYIDSYGRKKGLYQDPQYVLTDLLPREDLDNIGEKLNIKEDTPDRDTVIKGKAHDLALQANTLWMLTAGPGVPLLTTGICMGIEKAANSNFVIKKSLEFEENDMMHKKLNSKGTSESVAKKVKSFSEFLTERAEQSVLDSHLQPSEGTKETLVKFDEVFKKLGKTGYAEVLKGEIKSLVYENRPKISEDLVKTALSMKKELSNYTLSDGVKSIIASKKTEDEKINELSAQIAKDKKLSYGPKRQNFVKSVKGSLEKAITTGVKTKDVAPKLTKLYECFVDFEEKKKSQINNYVGAIIGSNTYNSKMWENFTGKLMSEMNLDTPFSTKELNKVRNGNNELIDMKLNSIVKKDNFSEIFNDFVMQAHNYKNDTHRIAIPNLDVNINNVYDEFDKNLRKNEFTDIADKIAGPVGKNVCKKSIEPHLIGECNSFYRMVHLLDIEKQMDTGDFQQRIKDVMWDYDVQKYNSSIIGENAQKMPKRREYLMDLENKYKNGTITLSQFEKARKKDISFEVFKKTFKIDCNEKGEPYSDLSCKKAYEGRVNDLAKSARKVVMEGTFSDFIQKFKNPKTGIVDSHKAFGIVMDVLYGDDSKTILGTKTLNQGVFNVEQGTLAKLKSGEDAVKIFDEYSKYKELMKTAVVNCRNDVSPSDKVRQIGTEGLKAFDSKISAIVGKPIREMIIDTAKQTYNSKKWTLYFAAAATALTTFTVAATTMFCKKSKAE